MGRWAEVYFRNPPENRERAVLELLQELERENAAQRGGEVSARWTEQQGLTEGRGTESDDRRSSAPEPSSEVAFGIQSEASAQVRPSTIGCGSCGHENDGTQRFCGMCGMPLRTDAVSEPEAESRSHIVGGHESNVDQAGQWTERPVVQEDSRARQEDRLYGDRSYGDRSSDDPSYSDGLIRSLGYAPVERSWRGYAGAGLVIVILALGYFAYKNEAWKNFLLRESPPRSFRDMPATAPQSAEQIAASSLTEANASNPAAPTKVTGNSSDITAKEKQVSLEQVDAKRESPAARVTKEPVETGSRSSADSNSGSEELNIARSFLNGAAGHQPDHAEAAGWLWKAVAKRNVEATLLLSDLYLRGDGIPKNCDQARVLLDAAASRGIKDAATRLRNMQAFGCQ